ncbi:hypothetical protein P4H71_10015 [Paenibacillus kribbensis]|nr:hypothetical protein [Paenibacillus kribbensis]MEC0234662.1 hypothetical protein [Paenibacillus kribbensis]
MLIRIKKDVSGKPEASFKALLELDNNIILFVEDSLLRMFSLW